LVSTYDDGSAGDADYGAIGRSYSRFRQPDPRIGAIIRTALGDAITVLNVGAGAGSYEPEDLQVTAVEPSATMRAQRPPHSPAAIDARAEALPFEDNSFDAAMALVTVHQWSDLTSGLRELRRVARGPVLVTTFDPDALRRFWLRRYAPEVISVEAGRMPRPERLLEGLGGDGEIVKIPYPVRLPRRLQRSLLRPSRTPPGGGCTVGVLVMELHRRRRYGALRGGAPSRPLKRRLGRGLGTAADDAGVRWLAPSDHFPAAANSIRRRQDTIGASENRRRHI